MVDRIKLLQTALPNADLSPKQKSAVNSNIEKALNEILSSLPFTEVSGVESFDDLILYILDSAPPKTLLAISKSWEPERGNIDPEQKSELKHDLVSLLRGHRQRYSKLEIALSEVREMDQPQYEAIKHTIDRIAPAADLSALIKRWDPDLPKIPKTRKEQIPHLLALASGNAAPHPSKKLSLEKFRELIATAEESPLSQLESREALKTLLMRLKKWDKHLNPLPATKADAINHIKELALGLLEPLPKPSKRTGSKS